MSRTPASNRPPNKIEGRLRRYKQRLKGHAAPPASGKAAKSRTISWSRQRNRKNPPRVSIRSSWPRERRALKSLSVASAVAELDLSGAPVVVFEHAGSGRVNIVYRRRDGAIGWLDPH